MGRTAQAGQAGYLTWLASLAPHRWDGDCTTVV